MKKKSKNTPKGRLVEIDGVTYLLIDGNLLRYADLTFDKGFKIVLGCIGSEDASAYRLLTKYAEELAIVEILKHLEAKKNEKI